MVLCNMPACDAGRRGHKAVSYGMDKKQKLPGIAFFQQSRRFLKLFEKSFTRNFCHFQTVPPVTWPLHRAGY
ncbi:hypothetical protein S101446_00630 [Komagataeibacter europaeus]|nr:hypothetical protein S101446_00630 [Komagataeibacter europaeus]